MEGQMHKKQLPLLKFRLLKLTVRQLLKVCYLQPSPLFFEEIYSLSARKKNTRWFSWYVLWNIRVCVCMSLSIYIITLTQGKPELLFLILLLSTYWFHSVVLSASSLVQAIETSCTLVTFSCFKKSCKVSYSCPHAMKYLFSFLYSTSFLII